MTRPVEIKGLRIGEGMPKICVPVMGEDLDALCREAHKAKEAGADLVEWRVDFYKELTNVKALEAALEALNGILEGIPLLFTIRTKKEGGNAELSIEDYVNLNLAAAGTGKADLVDVEVFQDKQAMSGLIKALKKEKTAVIASSHDFEKTDDKETLKKRFLEMDATGADILKMAVMPQEFEDAAALMQATSEVAKDGTEKPLISMAMGSPGFMTRIAGENFGSSVTFACVDKSSAPGQFPIGELRIMMEALHRKNQE
ncbi:MAG TPA: type I 3-dehydroquinate dehydratase [Candidatus Blautia faecigallinarum]|uniref:3-dehydroquinate dehydratase n=1 Tax=Candidatus Blautia faecigallinarum TaxID=2838488 RepID=A0A9D2DUG2_9FIRM|nr:type I 3-dehydroquinate dehydratase [Candidatus Blautia faecigallinarum]